MRTTLFALALFLAVPAIAASSADASDLRADTTATEVSPVVVQSTAHLVIRTPLVVTATIALHDQDGREVRSFKDRLLWDGENVFDLDLAGITAGTYLLVVKTRLGSQTTELLVQ